jgi:predicted DNA-binding ribbon-helix-helix protein
MSDEHAAEQQAYEARLQRRLQILKEQFDAGKVRIAEGLQVVESLKRVRYSTDGTVDLSSVDGLVRSMALAVEVMHDRDKMKSSTSLAQIQNEYFDFLETNFGSFFKVMVERGLTPHDAGRAFSRAPSTVAELTQKLPDFLAAIEGFWNAAGPIAIAHVEDMHDALKGVYGGDLFPSPDENIASKCALYTDTLVLPDPFLRTKHMFERLGDDRKTYYLIKHAMNLLQYRILACADVNPPIVVVLPDVSVLEEGEKQFYYQLGQDDALIHGARVFGRRFSSFEELLEFSQQLDTIERAASAVSDPDRVLFDTDWKGSLSEQLERATKIEAYSAVVGTSNPGVILASQALGRMSISNELLIKARRLRGTPIIDAPTSWQYFVWKLEYDGEQSGESAGLRDLHTVRGLQSLAANEMRWLGRVPPEALIELRKSGALGEVRAILGKGVEELAAVDPSNFHRTSDLVFDNIHTAFAEHQRNVDALAAKKWKFAGSDIGSWIVVGSLAAAAAATSTPAWGLAALAAEQMLRAPKLREIPSSIKALAKETQELKRSPVGLLFKYSKSGV